MKPTYKATDFISPADDNQWMLSMAQTWMSAEGFDDGRSDIEINIVSWAKKNPESAFGLIQTLLKFSEDNKELFELVSTGPLELFLSQCSDEFAELVFEVVEIDPRLRRAFQYLWKSGMSDNRYQKILKINQSK